MAPRPFSTEDERDTRVPWLSLAFGYGPMLPIAAAGIAVWTMAHPWPLIATQLGLWWAASILIFLAGVRRGYAFTMAGGERPAQMATMIWLFVLGAGAFAMPTPTQALALLLIGYVSVAVLDPIAARKGEAPAHFASLRPPQMAIGAVSLAAMIGWYLLRPVAG